MVVQNPFEMGIQTVRLLTAIHAGDRQAVQEMFPDAAAPDGDIFTTGLRLIVPDEGSALKPEDAAGPGVEFLPLSKFREWLARYGLSSS